MTLKLNQNKLAYYVYEFGKVSGEHRAIPGYKANEIPYRAYPYDSVFMPFNKLDDLVGNFKFDGKSAITSDKFAGVGRFISSKTLRYYDLSYSGSFSKRVSYKGGGSPNKGGTLYIDGKAVDYAVPSVILVVIQGRGGAGADFNSYTWTGLGGPHNCKLYGAGGGAGAMAAFWVELPYNSTSSPTDVFIYSIDSDGASIKTSSGNLLTLAGHGKKPSAGYADGGKAYNVWGDLISSNLHISTGGAGGTLTYINKSLFPSNFKQATYADINGSINMLYGINGGYGGNGGGSANARNTNNAYDKGGTWGANFYNNRLLINPRDYIRGCGSGYEEGGKLYTAVGGGAGSMFSIGGEDNSLRLGINYPVGSGNPGCRYSDIISTSTTGGVLMFWGDVVL